MSVNNGYNKSEVEFNEADNGNAVQVATSIESGQRTYTYDEALNIAGTGWYSWYLMSTASLSLVAACVDIFGYSLIVSGNQCEFQLEFHHKSALLSMPFLGPIFMSYLWGYLSDTRGRRRCLIWAMWAGCVASFLGAFSPNYVVNGLLKFISTGFCCCAQSTSYVLMGESSSTKARGPMLMVISGILGLCFIIFTVPAYYILNMDIAIPIYGLTITPWRILAMVLAVPLAITGIMLIFVYESPKFVASMDRDSEALEILRNIWKHNGNRGEYPVKAIKQEKTPEKKPTPLLKSLWEQTAPLFRPPLLWRTLQLYYLVIVLYSINNSLSVWLPFISEAFFDGVKMSSDGDAAEGLCAMISQRNNVNLTASANMPELCTVKMEANTMYLNIAEALIILTVSLLISPLVVRKKATMLGLLTVPALFGLGAVLIPHNTISLVMFILLLVNMLSMGLIFTYFVDLYPTTHRGMVSGLGIIIARCSALAGVNIIGAIIMDHCSITMYTCSAFMLSGALMALFLPADKVVKSGSKVEATRTSSAPAGK